MTSINDAISFLNDLTGKTDLSNYFRSCLEENGLTETDGYLIKSKLNYEVLSEKIRLSDINKRLNFLVSDVADKKAYNGDISFNMDLILYLYNQPSAKVTCDNCGCELLLIDKYCSKCGSEFIPKISFMDLMAAVDLEDILPGDMLKINEDNTVEKIAFNSIVKSTDDKTLKEVYESKIEENRLNFKFFKILLLSSIRNKNVIDSQKVYDYNVNLNEAIADLIDEGFIKLSEDANLEDDNNGSDTSFSLTDMGSVMLDEYYEVLLYDLFIKDCGVDDIKEFNNLIESNITDNENYSQKLISDDVNVDEFLDVTLTYDDIIPKYLKNMKDIYLNSGNLEKYLICFDVEAYFYERADKKRKWIIALLKRFIANINMGYLIKENSNGIINASSLKYMQNILTKYSIQIDELEKLFNVAYNSFDTQFFKFSLQTTLEYLLRSFDEDVEEIDMELKSKY